MSRYVVLRKLGYKFEKIRLDYLNLNLKSLTNDI